MSFPTNNEILNPKQLRQTNYQLKCENEFLKTDLIRIKLLLISFEKYFNYVNEINETIASNNEVLFLKNNIKVLKECQKSCFVSLKSLNKNQFNHLGLNSRNNLSQPIVDIRDVSTQTQTNELETTSRESKEIRTKRKIIRNDHHLNDEEVSDDSEGIDCNIEDTNQSNDETIDENSYFVKKIVEVVEQLNNNKEDTNCISNEILETNYDNLMDSCIQQKDNEMEVNSDTDCDTVVDEQQMSDTSEDQSIKGNDFETLNKNSDEINEPEKDVMYSCDHIGCDKSYNRKDMLSLHKELHLGIQYVCDWNDCTKVFTAKRYYKRHLTHDHKMDVPDYHIVNQNPNQLENGMYGCDHFGCEKQFREYKYLSQHKQTHTTGHVYRCESEDCSKAFKTKKSLKMHLNKHKGSYPCTHSGCQYSAGATHLLAIHELTHLEDKRFKCVIKGCDKPFKLMKTLLKHQLIAHPNEMINYPWISCTEDDCQYKTKSTKSLKEHIRRHTRPFVCSHCERTFADKRILTKHMKVHSPEQKFACSWPGCGQLFPTQYLMKDHTNRHTLELTHSCIWPGCTQTFVTKKLLSLHIQRHKGKGRYNCPHCDYGSTNTIRYKNHLKNHEK